MYKAGTTFYVHGGLHSVWAARECYKKYKLGLISKELYDPRWQSYPSRVYLFDKSYQEVQHGVLMLGHEDNQSYQKVSGFNLHLFCRRLHSANCIGQFVGNFLHTMHEGMRMGISIQCIVGRRWLPKDFQT